MTSHLRAITPLTISAGSLVLRPLERADETAVATALRDAQILRWAAGTAVNEAAEGERASVWLRPRINSWAAGSAVFAIADAASGVLLGSVSIREVNRLPGQAAVTYWITPEARGRGAAPEALAAAASWAFAPSGRGGLALHRLTLDHALVNAGSCRVAGKAGFALEGTMRDFFVDAAGERHDSHLHARLATDR